MKTIWCLFKRVSLRSQKVFLIKIKTIKSRMKKGLCLGLPVDRSLGFAANYSFGNQLNKKLNQEADSVLSMIHELFDQPTSPPTETHLVVCLNPLIRHI